MKHMTIDEWLAYGVEHKYCSPPVCDTHEGIPLTEEEVSLWDEGEDPCAVAVRIWLDD